MFKPNWLVFILLIIVCNVCDAESVWHLKAVNKGRFLCPFETAMQGKKDTTIIRFDYKQSALFHAFTFESIDSVVNILLKNKPVTLSIDGYAYKDEGSDTICYYLSLNRALFIQTYVLGRGIDSSRIISLNAWGNSRQSLKYKDKDGLHINCRAEMLLHYPPPPVKVVMLDRDEDGISDAEDKCPDEFGHIEKGGCPNTNRVIVPFAIQEASLYSMTYRVLDSVIAVLMENPTYTIGIEGHAYKTEGISTVCESLAIERAEIVKQYLISRRIDQIRISSVKSYSNLRPLNAGKNPQDMTANARVEITVIK